MTNGDTPAWDGIQIHAVPMYNLTPSHLKNHPKRRGNGYVLTLGGNCIYISGDTEGTPKVRALEHTDVAFVCMNLPLTMDVAHGADAVLAFKDAGITADGLQHLRAYARQERALGDERVQHMAEITLGRAAAYRPRGLPRLT